MARHRYLALVAETEGKDRERQRESTPAPCLSGYFFFFFDLPGAMTFFGPLAAGRFFFPADPVKVA